MSAWIRRGVLAAIALGLGGYYVHHRGWVEPALAWCDKAFNGPLVFLGVEPDDKPRTLAQVAGGDAVAQEASRILITPSQARSNADGSQPISIFRRQAVTGITVPKSAWMARAGGNGPRFESLPAISTGGGAGGPSALFANGSRTNPFSESIGAGIIPPNDMLPPRTVTAVQTRPRGSAVSFSTR